MKGLVIGRYIGAFDPKAKVSFNGKLVGHLARVYKGGWHPRFGPVKGPFQYWIFSPADGGKDILFYYGKQHRDRTLTKLYDV
jgi:hypothetical protein